MPRPKSETVEGKPPYSYVSLCCMAIMSSPMKMVTLSQIYEFITENFVYYRNTTNKWQNSLRHNLSYNQCFIKIPRGGGGKGNYWALHPRASAMFENGTAQRRKKRFKVEDDDSEGGFKVGPELLGPGYPYIVPNIDAYIDHNTVPANAPKIANDLVREHREWLQSRLSSQENEEDSDSSQQSNGKHLAESANTAKIFAFTIENLLKPDSPKRKKKVYRSTEAIEADSGADSSSSGNKKTRDRVSCARKIGTSVNVGSSPLYLLDPHSPDLLTPPKKEQPLHCNISYNPRGLPQMPSYLPHPISQYQSSSSAFTQADLNTLVSLPGYGYSPYAGMMSLPQSYPPLHMYPQATGAHPYPVGMYPYDTGFPGYGGHSNQSLLLGS